MMGSIVAGENAMSSLWTCKSQNIIFTARHQSRHRNATKSAALNIRRFNTSQKICNVRAGGSSSVSTDHMIKTATNTSSSELLKLFEATPLDQLMSQARELRDKYHKVITFSPKVFIPLTRACRNSCGYCIFAQDPIAGKRVYMTIDEVLHVARIGSEQGCTEALFTLGDKPELKYKEAALELESMGFSSTVEYIAAAASAVLTKTSLLPHINAGVLDAPSLRALRAVSVSQGLMLESLSEDLLTQGHAHYDSPDKDPTARLETLNTAGKEKIPFTTGILIGIGESRQDRIDTLLAIRESHIQYGHIQEVIIQNFRAKKGTLMELFDEPSLDDFLWTVAVARLILGGEMSIQAPPNLLHDEEDDSGAINNSNNNNNNSNSSSNNNASALTPSAKKANWHLLLDAGINDWGGVSPITRDFVNPERPWPHISVLHHATAQSNKYLVPRLSVYPKYIHQEWLDGSDGVASPLRRALQLSDAYGLARSSRWRAGSKEGTHDDESGGHYEESLLMTPAPALKSNDSDSDGDGKRRASPLPRQLSWNVSMSHKGILFQNQRGTEGRAHAPSIDELCFVEDVSLRSDIHAILSSVLSSVPSTASTHDTVHTSAHHRHDSSNNQAQQPYLLSEDEIVTLFHARGRDFDNVIATANTLNSVLHPDNVVSFVINRNINYTNICTYGCRFCAFSKGPPGTDFNLRGPSYLLSMDEVKDRTREAWEKGATEVCLQGGIHPDFTGKTYLEILDAAKRGAPDIHIHAFSPLEVMQGAKTMQWSLERYLKELKNAGIGSLPGTAAEILDDSIRKNLCPDKLNTQEWLDVIETAHSVGLKTTSTIMFGHIDTLQSWAKHLILLRDLQRRTNGLTEFVPLPFVCMESPIYRQGKSRAGPTLHESMLMHAVARIVLYPFVKNIQASWVKMGPERAAGLLAAGCNDMGGVLMNESITRAAGATFGQELSENEMRRLIVESGRFPVQRTTLYGRI